MLCDAITHYGHFDSPVARLHGGVTLNIAGKIMEIMEDRLGGKISTSMFAGRNVDEGPDAFLRRCFFHYIRFPDRDTMLSIIDVHFPDIQKSLVGRALDIFYEIRDVPGLKKKPSTSELLDWLKLLLHEDMPLEVLQSRDPTKAIPPLHGALLKNEADVMLFERLAFMARRNG